jgi:glycerol-3-phosphate responsive antiterminator
LIVKNGDKVVSTVRPEAVQALPGPLPDSVTLIAEMGFQSLPAGNYMLEVKARDIVRNVTTTGSASFQLK